MIDIVFDRVDMDDIRIRVCYFLDGLRQLTDFDAIAGIDVECLSNPIFICRCTKIFLNNMVNMNEVPCLCSIVLDDDFGVSTGLITEDTDDAAVITTLLSRAETLKEQSATVLTS